MTNSTNDLKHVFSKMSEYKIRSENEERDIIVELRKAIKQGRHTILIGPPGTGKTRAVLKCIQESQDLGLVRIIQFHPQYSYQDFVEGYIPKNGQFVYRSGAFKDFLLNAKQKKMNVFVIDEINRADISSVFGELLFLLDNKDEGREVTLPISGETLSMGSNIIVIGTMNSADKNIALMDFAIRRRFGFIYVEPDMNGLGIWLNQYGFHKDVSFDISTYIDAIRKINLRIIKHPLLGKNMCLGQSLFVPPCERGNLISLEMLTDNFNAVIVPQLESYLGYSNIQDIGLLLSPEIRTSVEQGKKVSTTEFCNLVTALSYSQESSNL